jgi:hypothetical protein
VTEPLDGSDQTPRRASILSDTPSAAYVGQKDGSSCPGCGLPNYRGLCPVCRGDEQGYRGELQFAFGPWHKEDE